MPTNNNMYLIWLPVTMKKKFVNKKKAETKKNYQKGTHTHTHNDDRNEYCAVFFCCLVNHQSISRNEGENVTIFQMNQTREK